jgi:xanthine dehydrogenase/oxidase
MGLGFWLLEKVKYDPNTGKLLTNGTWEYKPPFSKDLPVDFRVSFLNNNPNVTGVFGSKCIGEPPLCLTPSVAFAVKRAIEAARLEIKQNNTYFSFDAPTTVESVQQLCLIDVNQFELN